MKSSLVISIWEKQNFYNLITPRQEVHQDQETKKYFIFSPGSKTSSTPKFDLKAIEETLTRLHYTRIR